MPVYYFHLRDGHDTLLDPDGRNLESPDAIARALISDEVRLGRIHLDQRIDVEDADGQVVHSQPFDGAVEIVGGAH